MRFLTPHLAFLKKLARQKNPEKTNLYLATCSPTEIKLLVEICYNILRGNIKLTNKQKEKLVPFAALLRRFSKTRSAFGAKKAIQTGGGFPLAAIAVPILAELLRYLAKQ